VKILAGGLAREPMTIGDVKGRSGKIPEPMVKVQMGED
jgi:hypothetical protein